MTADACPGGAMSGTVRPVLGGEFGGVLQHPVILREPGGIVEVIPGTGGPTVVCGPPDSII